MGRRVVATLLVAAFWLPLAFAQWGRGGGDPRGYGGGGYGGGGGGDRYGGGGYQQQQPAANAVARPGGDSSLDDSVRLFLQLDQDGMLVFIFAFFCPSPVLVCVCAFVLHLRPHSHRIGGAPYSRQILFDLGGACQRGKNSN